MKNPLLAVRRDLKCWTALALVLSFASFLVLATVAEARIGGGRSSGSRGFRGFGSRQSQTSPSRSNPNPQQPRNSNAPQNPSGQPAPYAPPASGGGTFTRGLMGGLAGGFIGSMLFRNMGNAGMGGPGTGGFGFLELMLIAGLAYFGFRFLMNRRAAATVDSGAQSQNWNSGARSEDSNYSYSANQNSDSEVDGEAANISKLRTYDPSFDFEQFKDQRMDEFLALQSAWNLRDLSSVGSRIAPELRKALDADIIMLQRAGRINRIENIAVRNTQLIDVWHEYGQEFATLRFKANLIDYTVEESSNTLVAGDRSQPVKFEEDWTFVRGVNPGDESWKLSAIES